MDYNLIKCFQTVAKTGSISEASKTLHLSQPAISLQIKRLEEQIGQKLFDRHNRGLIITQFGKKFLEVTQKFNDLEQELDNIITGSETLASGIVKIGTYTTASSYLLATPIANFVKTYPNVSILYDYSASEDIIQKIKNYELDCAILSDVPKDKLINAYDFYKDELVFVQKPKGKTKLTKITPKDLSDFNFLSYPLRYDLCYKTVEKKFGRYLAKARATVISESFDTLKQMLIMGAGATFIPRYLIRKELEAGLLQEIEIRNHRLPITFSFITKSEVPSTHTINLLRQSIVEHAERLYAPTNQKTVKHCNVAAK